MVRRHSKSTRSRRSRARMTPLCTWRDPSTLPAHPLLSSLAHALTCLCTPLYPSVVSIRSPTLLPASTAVFSASFLHSTVYVLYIHPPLYACPPTRLRPASLCIGAIAHRSTSPSTRPFLPPSLSVHASPLPTCLCTRLPITLISRSSNILAILARLSRT